MTNKRMYWVWSDMRQRCQNPNHKAYKNYGGRGIYVCDRWMIFANFMADMGMRPEGGAMIDRIDNNGPYSPENCKWSTRKEQNSNRRNCIYVECDGERVTLREYCRRKNMNYRPVVKRIQNLNWPLDLALTVPLSKGKKLSKLQKGRLING